MASNDSQSPSQSTQPPQFKAPVSPPRLQAQPIVKGLLPSKDHVSNPVIPQPQSDIKTQISAPSSREQLPKPNKPSQKTSSIPSSPSNKPLSSAPKKLEIHTMKDDMEALRASTLSTPQILPSKDQKPVPVVKTISKTSSPSAQQTQVSVSGTPSAVPKRIVSQPSVPSKKAPRHRKTNRKTIRSLFLTILLLVITLGGAGAFWWYFGDMILPSSETDTILATASQVLPSNYSMIIGYHFDTLSDRTSVSSVWQKQRGDKTEDISDLLSGDPRLLIDDPEITQIYYAILSDSPRPYLIVPQVESTTALFDAAASHIQATTYKGWYVVHPVATEKFIQAVSDSQLANDSTDYSVLVSTQANAPIRVLLNASVIAAISQDALGEGLGSAQLSQLNLIGYPANDNSTIEFTGEAVQISSTITNGLMLQNSRDLLNKIPDSATFIRLGGSFADDLREWSANATEIDQDAINLPNVRQTIDQLESPYAFYIIEKSAGERDFGLIIDLPSDYQNFITEPDSVIEAGLAALIPILTGRQSVASVAFSDGAYSGVNLRYVNFSGSNSALDYAISDQYLLIGTSKDAMFDLIDTVLGNNSSVPSSSLFTELLNSWGVLPESQNLVISQVGYEYLSQILPISSPSGEFNFGYTSTIDSNSPSKRSLSGIIQLNNSSESSD